MTHETDSNGWNFDLTVLEYLCPHDDDDVADTDRAYTHFDEIINLYKLAPPSERTKAEAAMELLFTVVPSYKVTQDILCYFMFKYHCGHTDRLIDKEKAVLEELDNLYGFKQTYRQMIQVENKINLGLMRDTNNDDPQLMDLYRIERIVKINEDVEDFGDLMPKEKVLESLHTIAALGNSENHNIRNKLENLQDNFLAILSDIRKEETETPTPPSGP